MKTVAEVIGASRSNLADRLQERCKKRIGRPRPDDELVSNIKAVIAELATRKWTMAYLRRSRRRSNGSKESFRGMSNTNPQIE